MKDGQRTSTVTSVPPCKLEVALTGNIAVFSLVWLPSITEPLARENQNFGGGAPGVGKAREMCQKFGKPATL